jgi:hypothetical protein
VGRRRVRLGRGGRLAATTAVAALLAVLAPASAEAVPADAWWYSDLNLPAAWKISKGAGITIAVIDTGVKATLGDLRGQVLPGIDLTGASPDGREDVGPADNPLYGHGTEIAAIIAGTGAGTGLVGVAPAAKILPVRVGIHAESARIATAIRWAVDHRAKIVNLSLGSYDPCPTDEQAAITYAVEHDVIVVAASGDSANQSVGAPANCVGALAIGGIEPGAAFKPWTGGSTGPGLDFVAPGDKLAGLYLNGQHAGPNGAGTSIAAALVSGTFALLRSKFAHETARQIVTRALWNVHNGLGGKIFATRINDKLGYGEILPYYALTAPPPAGAANPIYDEIAATIPSSSNGAPSSATPSTSARTSNAAGSHSKSGGIGTAPVVVGVGVALAVALAVALGARRRGVPARR